MRDRILTIHVGFRRGDVTQGLNYNTFQPVMSTRVQNLALEAYNKTAMYTTQVVCVCLCVCVIQSNSHRMQTVQSSDTSRVFLKTA